MEKNCSNWCLFWGVVFGGVVVRAVAVIVGGGAYPESFRSISLISVEL